MVGGTISDAVHELDSRRTEGAKSLDSKRVEIGIDGVREVLELVFLLLLCLLGNGGRFPEGLPTIGGASGLGMVASTVKVSVPMKVRTSGRMRL